MDHFRRKIIITVLLAVFFTAIFGTIVTLQNYRALSREALKEKPLSREEVRVTLQNLSDQWKDHEEKIIERYQVEAVFASLALSHIDENKYIVEKEARENGAVISTAGGKLSAPEEVSRKIGLDLSLFQDKTGYFAAPNDPSTLVVYSRIGDSDNYYLEWYQDTVLSEVVRESVDISSVLQKAEIAYDVSAIFVSCDPDSNNITGIVYKNDQQFANLESVKDLGLSRKDLEKADGKSSGVLTYGDTKFTYVSGKSQVPSGYLILLEEMPNLFIKALGRAGYMIATLIILLATLLVTGFSHYTYVKSNILTPDQEKAFRPSRVRSLIVLFGLYGTIMLIVSGIFIYMLDSLYDDTVDGRERLAVMTESIQAYSEQYDQNKQSFEGAYVEYGNHIARFLDEYPNLRSSSLLATLAESISASSITLYDANGSETVSSGPWIGLELGKDPESSTYDFRRILKGVPSIVHDQEKDEITGLNEMRLGIRIRDAASKDRYGVMIISVDPSSVSEHDSDPKQTVRNILKNLCDDKTTLWISDAKTGRIYVSSAESLEGSYISELGLDESDLKESLVKMLETKDGAFFITSAPMETSDIPEWPNKKADVIAYYMGTQSRDLAGMIRLCLTGCLLFIFIYTILAGMTLREYTDEFFNTYKNTAEWEEEPEEKKGLLLLLEKIRTIPPGRRGVITMEVVVAIILIALSPFMSGTAGIARNTVYYYILSGNWEKGLNLFAVAGIVILLSKTFLLVITTRFLTALFAALSGPKGKTIFRLIASVVMYVSIFAFLILACEYLGLSRTTIITGIGSLALAISLGAQNFVSDIIAGMTYVADGTIHVGDKIVVTETGVPPFQGIVNEIGVRSITLLTKEGNVVTVSNRDIRLITNLTQMNSLVICELTVSSDVSAVEIEEMLKKELPKIGRKDVRFHGSPKYNGLTKIGNGTMTFSISAECREEDYSYVKNKLNISLQQIFLEHGYNL